MKRISAYFAILSLAAASCGASGPSSCAEYAADLRERATSMSSEELSAYVDDSAESVARLISEDPDNAQACADAILEVLFTAGLEDVFTGLED